MKCILSPLSIELKGNISYKKVKEALKSSVNIDVWPKATWIKTKKEKLVPHTHVSYSDD